MSVRQSDDRQYRMSQRGLGKAKSRVSAGALRRSGREGLFYGQSRPICARCDLCLLRTFLYPGGGVAYRRRGQRGAGV